MFKRFSINYMVFLFIIDLFLVQLSLWLGIQLRFLIPIGQIVRPEHVPEYVYIPGVGMHAMIGLLWAICMLIASCYTPRKIIFWFDEFQRLILAHTIAALSLAGLLYLANVLLLRLIFIYFYLVGLFALLGYRILLRIWHRIGGGAPNSVARILVAGAGKVGQNIVDEFTHQQWPGIEIVGYLDDDPQKRHRNILGLPVLGKLNQASQIIEKYGVDEVIITLPRDAHANLANLAARLYELPVRIRVVPDYFDLAFYGATIESLGGIPLIGLRDSAIDGFQRFLKRLIDIAVSVVGLFVLSPLLAIVAILIKLDDRGPIFYRAARVGENGLLFDMFKFRSMVVDADQFQPQVNQDDNDDEMFHKLPDDPRVTRIGRFLRRTSIDEFPQLINVLKGDMSLVGPRPELPWLVKQYEPWQRKRFAVPQGITGWWQVNGRSDNLMHLHTEQDLYYIQNYSLWLDVQILWRTIGVVLRGKGAY